MTRKLDQGVKFCFSTIRYSLSDQVYTDMVCNDVFKCVRHTSSITSTSTVTILAPSPCLYPSLSKLFCLVPLHVHPPPPLTHSLAVLPTHSMCLTSPPASLYLSLAPSIILSLCGRVGHGVTRAEHLI